MHRLAVLTALVLLPACDLGPPDRYERLTLDATDLRALTIESGAGDIVIDGDPAATEVSIVAGIHGDHTRLTHTRVGDALQLAHTCGSWGECAVDWKIVAPAALAADLNTGSGDVRVAGLDEPLRVRTGSGDIELADLSADIDLETGSGDVAGRHLQCPQFRGETGSGDLDLALSARPRSVWWSSGSGDVDLALPAGRYALDLETGSGDIDLSGVRRDAATDASLRLHTGSGDIAVAG